MPSGLILPAMTAGLVLRDFTEDDIAQMIEIVQHPHFTGYRRFRPTHIVADVTEYINEAIEQQISAEREIFRLAICLKDNTRQAIGFCVFHGWNLIATDNDQIGYFLHPEHQGRGYVVEAMRHVLQAYFSQYPDRAVEATAHPANVASQHVLTRLGFANSHSKTINVNGVEEPRLVYVATARAFQAAEKTGEL